LKANRDYTYSFDGQSAHKVRFKTGLANPKDKDSAIKTLTFAFDGQKQTIDVTTMSKQPIYFMYVSLCRPAANNTYVIINGTGEDDWCCCDTLWSFSNGQLSMRADLLRIAPDYIEDRNYADGTPVSAKDGQIVIQYGSPHFLSVGMAQFNVVYNAVGGAVSLASPQSDLDFYEGYHENRVFQAARAFGLSDQPGGAATISVAKGQKVTLEAVTSVNGLTYFQASLAGSKSGWFQEITAKDKPLFLNVQQAV
jgi:hypothetical protein